MGMSLTAPQVLALTFIIKSLHRPSQHQSLCASAECAPLVPQLQKHSPPS